MLFVKPVGCKISDELYQIIENEVSKIGITKSNFFRMLINNYFKDHKIVGISPVNQLTAPVNQFSDNDEYQNTRREVNSFLKGFNKKITK